MNIVLIGPRGSGKTTIGKLLAERLDRPFVDLDEQVLARLGRGTVHEVWEACGEPVWREAEAAALASALQLHGQVVALGGGTPIVPAARRLLEQARDDHAALLVYLRCSAATLARRLRDAPGDRPSLTGRGAAEEVGEILAQREPTYRVLADLECDVDNTTADAACAVIIRELAAAERRRA